MPRLSFIMITARSDFPYLNHPDLNVFTPTLESFRKQTFTDFEWIIVDALYEQRKDYFKDMKLPFKVKHIPAQPNLWIEQGMPGICAQYNKGIIYADGELLFFTGDSHMATPDFMENMNSYYTQGYFPLAWYMYDHSRSEPSFSAEVSEEKHKLAYPDRTTTPIPYNILGYTGKSVSIEHRYTSKFQDPNTTMAFAHWGWWFGISSASLEAMLKINGFNQNFDGDRMLLDCDVGSRLQLAGYGQRLALFRNFFLTRIPTDVNVWNQTIKKVGATIKCNLPLIWHSRAFERYRANTIALTDEDIVWMKKVFCAERCDIRETCKREHQWQYPFEHKDGYPGHNSSKKWFDFWKTHQTLINLTEEREKRLKIVNCEGTFI